MDDKTLIQARSQYENLETNYNRMLRLRENNAVDQQALDDVESAYLIAKSTYEGILEDTEIRSPLAGMVTFIALKEGDTYNNLFDPVLIRIVNLDELQMRIKVSDIDVTRISLSSEVLISTDDFDSFIEGEVFFVADEAELMCGKYNVLIEIPDPSSVLRHNQYARARVLVKISRDALSIPQDAVFEENSVFVVSEGKAELRPVITGLENEDMIEILSGIDQGETVIIEGIIGLSDGDHIEVTD
jgi:RND family efflux transporter MFP subunit